MENRYIIIGEAIKQARREIGMFRSELANQLKKSYNCVLLWERGDRKIAIDQLEKIAEILNKPITYFLDFKEENITKKSDNASDFLELVDNTIEDLKSKGFDIKLYNEKGLRRVTNLNRLWTRLILNASESDKDIQFDSKLGGVENEKQLTDYLFDCWGIKNDIR